MKQIMDNREHNIFPESAPVPSPSLVRAISQLPRQYLIVITHPSVKTLRKERDWARWGIVIVQLLMLVIITVALNWLGHLIPSAALHTIATFYIGSLSPFSLLPAPYNGIVFILATFLIGLGTAYPFSRLLKGQGRFVEHTFVLLLVTIPLVTISGALLLIPATGTLVTVLISVVGALFLYRMILHILTMMAVHHLSAERATLIVLIIPILLALIALIILLIATLGHGLDGFDFDLPDFGGGSKNSKEKPQKA